MKISVIVPVYNCGRFLPECIESILNQTYKDFELLLLNDGSVDNSLDICLEYEKKDKRVRVYSHENMGAALTRKKGLQEARGEFVTFADSDDRFDAKYLETMQKEQLLSNADMVCCNCADSGVPNISIEEDETVTDKERLLNAFFSNKRYAYCIWAKLYRKSVLEKVNFPDMKYAEDTYVVTNAFRLCKSVRLIKYQGYFYTDNPCGAMRTSSGTRQMRDVLTLANHIYDLCEECYSDSGLKEKAEQRLAKSIFNVIIAGSTVSKEEWAGVKPLVYESFSKLGRDVFCKSVKGRVVLAYMKYPKLVGALLKAYRTAKYRKRIVAD